MQNLASTIRMLRPCLQGYAKVMVQAQRGLPYCSVETNLKKSQVPADFLMKLSKELADILNKDIKLVSVSISTDMALCRNGSDSPNAVISIWSLGVFDEERNPIYSKKIHDFLIPQLNLTPDRLAVFFHPINKESAAHLLYKPDD